MSQKLSNIITYLSLTAAMMCWGLSFVWYKQALSHFGPISLVLSRLVVSLPLVVISALLLKRLKRIEKKDIPTFALLAFLEPFLYFIGESSGMQYVSSTVASIIITTIPIFTSILAYFFLNEKMTPLNFLGVALSFMGVLFVVFADRENMQATYKGILLMLLAVFAAMGYGFVIKKIAHKYNSLTIVSTQNLFGIIYFIPIYFIFEHQDMVSKNWNFSMVKDMLYLAVFASTLAYLGFIEGLRKIGVSKATVFTNFIPVFTAIFAYILLQEPIGSYKIAGISLAICGLILSQTTRSRRKEKPEDKIVNELY